tara:strand:+ start:1568 stop:2383 length:816 start_codon:yes stop_codon:yes gene_type:complete
MREGFKLVSSNIDIVKKYNTQITTPQYFHSIIYQIYSKFYYKEYGGLIVARKSAIMGNYNLMAYCLYPITAKTEEELHTHKFSLRGTKLFHSNNTDYVEYIYDTQQYPAIQGKQFARMRNMIKRFPTTCETGYHKDIDEVVNAWSKDTKTKHQRKLWRVIKQHLTNVSILLTRCYWEGQIVGFSCVENIGNGGVIIMRLIHPDIKKKIKEPNLLIHYWDCCNNTGLLNIGMARSKEIKTAKLKLRPVKTLQYYKYVRDKENNLTRAEWHSF